MKRLTGLVLSSCALLLVGTPVPAHASTGTSCSAVVDSIATQKVTPVVYYLTAQGTAYCPGTVIGRMSASGATEDSGTDVCFGAPTCNLRVLATLTGSAGQEKCVTFYISAESGANTSLPAYGSRYTACTSENLDTWPNSETRSWSCRNDDPRPNGRR